MAEQTDNSFKFNWDLAAPAEGGQGPFGDYFPEGPRYRFKTSSCQKNVNKDSGKTRIDLTAVCIPGGTSPNDKCVGLTLKTSFNFPLPTEMGDAKKLYGARLFHAFMKASGTPQQEGEKEVPLDWFVGKDFEATVKDYTMAARDVTQADGTTKSYPAKTTSQIQMVYAINAESAATNTPVTTTSSSPAPATNQARSFFDQQN